MKIAESAIAMSSDRKALSMEQFNITRNVRMKRSDYNASKKKEVGILDAITEDDDEGDEILRADGAQVNISRQGQQVSSAFYAEKANEESDMLSEYESALETLKTLLKMLRTLGGSPKAIANLERQIEKQGELIKMEKNNANRMNFNMTSFSFSAASSGRRTSNIGDEMVDVTQSEHFEADMEYTTFKASGIAKTEDGRTLNFGIEAEMSREFMSYTKLNISARTVKLCDPLVINVGSNVASVSDQKFRFDIDADGSDEEISQLSPDSGFLAIDKNGDGKVNDGSELFGTKSGDGFGDLKAYDRDHNGWIDENDEIFDKLKIWFKDSEGNDRLLNLKEADVGAIFLGKANTEFHLNDEETNKTNAVIQSTGVYLKESGGVGTIQHVDMAV